MAGHLTLVVSTLTVSRPIVGSSSTTARALTDEVLTLFGGSRALGTRAVRSLVESVLVASLAATLIGRVVSTFTTFALVVVI